MQQSTLLKNQIKLFLFIFGAICLLIAQLILQSRVWAAPLVDPQPSGHPNGFTTTVDSSSQLTTTWVDAVGANLPSGYILLCNTTGVFVDPVDGVVQADDTDCSDGTGAQNILYGVRTAAWSGLNAGTEYFFKIYSYSNSDLDINYKTNGSPRTTSGTTLEVVNIKVTQAESIDPVLAGSGANNLVQTASVFNNSPTDATGVVVSGNVDIPASGVTISSITVGGGSHDLSTGGADTSGEWTIGNLAAGQTVTMAVAYTVDSTAAGGTNLISSTAELTVVNEEDITPGNNSATVATSITAAPATLTIIQNTAGGDTTSFSYSGDLGSFSLSHNDSESDSALLAGEYTVTQNAPTGWTLDSVVCSGGGSPTNVADGIKVTLVGGSNVECTFNNVKDEPTFDISDAIVVEGDSGQVNLEFTITRSNNAFANTVDVSTIDGSAKQGSDYIKLDTTTVNFSANGALTQSIFVSVNGDEIVEADETLTAQLSNPVNGTINDSQGEGTITNDEIATVSLSGAATVIEGNTQGNQVVYTATLDKAVQDGFQITNDTTSDVARAGSDFKDADGVLTFAGNAGETQQFILETLPDTVVEDDEVLTVSIDDFMSTSLGADRLEVAGSPIIATIENDDKATITLLPGPIKDEGGSGTTDFTFSAVLNNAIDDNFSVSYVVESGTAIVGEDFEATSGSVSFNGQQGEFANFVVKVKGDSKVELDEQFTVKLTGISGLDDPDSGEIVNGEQIATIKNDDVATVVLSPGEVKDEGNSGTVTYTFMAELDSDVDGGFTVAYTTQDGTATVADGDYNAVSGTWTFGGTEGETKSVTVTVNGDTKGEAPETFLLVLGEITPDTSGLAIEAGDPSEATIANDDSAVFFVQTTGMASEGDGVIPVTISLSTQIDEVATIKYTTADGTALAGQDYVADSGTLTFQPGDSSKTVNIQLIDDAILESTETFMLSISEPTGSILGEPAAVEITIEDDELGVVISIGEPISANEADGEATVTVELNKISPATTEVTLTTSDGTAIAGQDYTAVSEKVTFAPGETSKTVTIPLIDDEDAEGDEDLVLTLSDAVNASLEDNPVYPYVIEDDESVLSASISAVEMMENDSGQAMMLFEVTLSEPVPYNVRIRYKTEDDTAIAGEDYVAVEGDLIIQAGRINGTIGVFILGDNKKEGDETFKLILSGVPGDGFGPIAASSTVTGTIQEDDQIQEIFLPLVTR